MMKTTTRKNKQWLRNPDQRKNPKIYSLQFTQLKDGNFQILPHGCNVLMKKNQHSGEWKNVDIRDIACELRNNKIITL